MTIEDVIRFVSHNRGRKIRTIGQHSTFTVELRGDKALAFITAERTERNENFDWVGKSLKVLNASSSLKSANYKFTFNASYVLGLFREILAEVQSRATTQPLPAAVNISITEFFQNMLGANLNNAR